jgi:hypothetical protein
MLIAMAGIVMDTLLSRRTRQFKKEYELQMQACGESFFETAQILKRAQNLLVQGNSDNTSMGTITTELQIQANVCDANARSLLQMATAGTKTADTANDKDDSISVLSGDDDGDPQEDDTRESSAETLRLSDEPITNILQVYQNLNNVVKNFPRPVAIRIDLATNVPLVVVG